MTTGNSLNGSNSQQRLSDQIPAITVHSADVIINILARRRDPGPTATVSTPEALRLHHTPIADCARYDSLRRAS